MASRDITDKDHPPSTTQRLTRRTAMLGSAALAAAAGFQPLSIAQAASSLNWVASTRGMNFSAATQLTFLQNESDFVQALDRECEAIVPEWEMKWGPMEPSRGNVNFSRCDAMVAIAKRNWLRLRGHTLIWHGGLPDWVQPALAEQPDWSIIDNRVRGVMSRYGTDIIPRWDVLNEVIEPEDGRIDGLRNSIFLRAFGFDYIPRTLAVANTVRPNARLRINEYGFDYDRATNRARRRAMLLLVERLRRRSAPLDVVGIQGHLRLDGSPFSESGLREFLRELASMGVKIEITELDVKEYDFTLPVTQRDRLVADEVRRYLDVVLDEQAVVGLTTWGLSDRHSYLTTTEMRNNGQINRGLPLDQSLRPKPMYDAIARAMRGAPDRRTKSLRSLAAN